MIDLKKNNSVELIDNELYEALCMESGDTIIYTHLHCSSCFNFSKTQHLSLVIGYGKYMKWPVVAIYIPLRLFGYSKLIYENFNLLSTYLLIGYHSCPFFLIHMYIFVTVSLVMFVKVSVSFNPLNPATTVT